MIVSEKVFSAQTRIASHYVTKLEQINQAYLSGGENVQYALNLFDKELQQIRQWQSWSAENSQYDSTISKISAQIPIIGKDVLLIRLPLDERIAWAEISLNTSFSTDDTELIAENLLNLAETYNASGDTQRAIDCANQVFDYYAEGDNSMIVGRAYAMIAQAEMARGDVPTAKQYFEKSLEVFEYYREILLIADVQYNLSTIAGRMGDYDAAVTYVEQALPVFERYGNILRLGYCYNVLALIARMRNQIDLSIETHKKSVAYFESINYSAGLSTALANLSTSLIINDRFEEAEAVANRSLELAQQAGSKRGIVDAYLRLGRLYVGRKQYDRGEQVVLEAKKVTESLDHPYALTICFQILAHISHEQDRLDDAIRYIEAGLPVAREAGDNYAEAYFYSNIISVKTKQGNMQHAQQALYNALEPANRAGLHPQLQIMLDAIKVCQMMDDLEYAIRWTALLENYDLLPMVEQDMNSTRELLETLVSEAQFTVWFNEGKTLSLEDGLAELKHLLEARL